MHKVPVSTFFIGKGEPLTIISGPCIIESLDHTLACAEMLVEMMRQFPVNFIFKASYDKANRSSCASFRGVGLHEGLRILEQVKKEFGVPIISDVHTPEEANVAQEVLDVVQIPAFLCRQTDLVLACAATQKPVHVKKGQFMAPWDMKNVVDKITSCGNKNIIIADRGTCFGYNNLVSDMRSIPIMQQFGFPISFDASHSAQLPGSQGSATGGERKYIPTLAKAAIAAGCQALFIESHDNPSAAKSDSATVYPLKELPTLLRTLVSLYEVVAKEGSYNVT